MLFTMRNHVAVLIFVFDNESKVVVFLTSGKKRMS